MRTESRHDWSRRLAVALVFLGASVAPGTAAAAVEAPHELIVAFDAAASPADRAEARADVDTVRAENLGVSGLQMLRTDGSAAGAIDALNDLDAVRYAVPNIKVDALATPNDPQWNNLWAMPVISAPQAWDVTTGSPNIVIGIVDSGIAQHVDLDANRWSNAGETGGGKEANGLDDDHNGYVDDWRGWDFHDGNNDPDDDHGHGTHVSGTSSGVGNNGVGVVGVGWQSKLMALDVFDPTGSGWANNIVAAMAYAGKNGAQVVNLSLGGEGEYAPYVDVMNAYPRTIFVTAAGNGGADDLGDNNDSHRRDPCTAPAANNICVGASTPGDGRASFSNYGATSVDIAAPGTNIKSTVPGGGYQSWQGTSMATPHVTGAVALLFAHRPDALASQVKDAILSTADPAAAWSGYSVTGGRLNVAAALTKLEDYDPPGPPANTVLPTITGTASTTGLLTATRGTWTNEPSGYAYQWRSCDSGGSNCQDIVGATGTSFVPQASEVGRRIRVQVTATSPNGSGAATSNATAAVISPPVNTAAPTVSGTVRTGQTLTAGHGTWNFSPTGYAYMWQRCESDGVTCSSWSAGQTYTLSSTDAGYRFRVRVTAANPSGSTVAYSTATGAVLPLAPTLYYQPSVAADGGYEEGHVLVGNRGTWTPTPSSYSTAWLRCDATGANCSDIGGASQTTYTLASADVGHTIKFRVTATNAGGSNTVTTATSPVVTAAPTPPPTSDPTPPPTTSNPTPPPSTSNPIPPVDPANPTPVITPPPTSTPTPTPATATVTGASAARATGYVTATIKCTSTTDCSGAVTFTYKRTKLASARIELNGGSAKRGKVKIAKSALKKLPKRGKVTVAASVKLG